MTYGVHKYTSYKDTPFMRDENLIYKELEDCSFIRELHVYGTVVRHDSKKKAVQHLGFGKRLKWPDDYFTITHSINLQRYNLEDYQTSLFDFNNGLYLQRNYIF